MKISPTRHQQTQAHQSARLKVGRALLHPLWWIALAVLAFNDHFLKGADLLPELLTGKLSDVAGLFLAPPLLAALLGVRTKRGLAISYLSTGAIFAGIQLSPAFAAEWVDFLGSLGVSWRMWSDPLDLLALPVMAASWQILLPLMEREQAPLRLWEKTLKGSALAAGSIFCMATSAPDPGPEPLEPLPGQTIWDEIEGDVFIHNGTGAATSIRIRSLREDITLLDCDVIASNPGKILQPHLFAPAQTWQIPSGSNLPMLQASMVTGCHAILLEGDGLSSRLLFWRHNQFSWTFIPGGSEDTDANHTGGVTLSLQGGSLTLSTRENNLMYIPSIPTLDEVGEGCGIQDDAERLGWETPPPQVIGGYEIIGLKQGPDGCLGIDLQIEGAESPEPRWRVCLPEGIWPFETGDHIKPARWTSSDGNTHAITIERTTLASGETAQEELWMMLSGGQAVPNIGAEITFSTAVESTCGPLTDACGSVQQAAIIEAVQGSEVTQLRANEGTSISLPNDSSLELHVIHASLRSLINTSCDEGPLEIAEDLEVIQIYRRAILP